MLGCQDERGRINDGRAGNDAALECTAKQRKWRHQRRGALWSLEAGSSSSSKWQSPEVAVARHHWLGKQQ